jgi:hypothetical protein
VVVVAADDVILVSSASDVDASMSADLISMGDKAFGGFPDYRSHVLITSRLTSQLSSQSSRTGTRV